MLSGEGIRISSLGLDAIKKAWVRRMTTVFPEPLEGDAASSSHSQLPDPDISLRRLFDVLKRDGESSWSRPNSPLHQEKAM